MEITPGPEGINPDTPGVIRGVVTFLGEAPAPRKIQISGGGCHNDGDVVLSESLVVADGKVSQAFVYISRGLPKDAEYEIPEEPASLDQVGCMYTPHVVGVRVGQMLHVKNSDSTTHNVHSDKMNQTQPAGSRPREVVYERELIGHQYRCDIHPWMSAYVCAVDHPFYALTGTDGAFSLPELPPGKYRLQVWQEKCGVSRVDFELPPGGEAGVTFKLSLGDGTSGSRRRRR